MSLHDKVARQLQIASQDEAFAAETFVAIHDLVEVHVEFLAVDTIGCSVGTLEFRNPLLENQTTDQLRDLTEGFAGRVTYLLEPIRTIETDPDKRVVQMRSAALRQNETERCYYEMTVSPTAIRVCRYKKNRGTPRVRTPSHLTHEVLLRLIDDLCRLPDSA